jgi:hypothetical protein
VAFRGEEGRRNDERTSERTSKRNSPRETIAVRWKEAGAEAMVGAEDGGPKRGEMPVQTIRNCRFGSERRYAGPVAGGFEAGEYKEGGGEAATGVETGDDWEPDWRSLMASHAGAYCR